MQYDCRIFFQRASFSILEKGKSPQVPSLVSRVDGEALSLFSFSKNRLQLERCVLEHCHEVNEFLLAPSLADVFQSINLTFPVFYVCKMFL